MALEYRQWQDEFCSLPGYQDTVDHKILIDKLYFYGVVEQELDFFRSYASDRVHCCNVKGVSSGFENITCGVLQQGSLLGPLLFYSLYE